MESANCRLLYLPPYSPDFNPIEQKWGHVKNTVKKIRNKFENFNECLDMALMGVQIYVLVYRLENFDKMLTKPLFSGMYFAKKSKAQVKNSDTNSPNLRISLTSIQPIKSMVQKPITIQKTT